LKTTPSARIFAGLSPAEISALVAAAREIRPRAYAPYSGYFVGAALQADDGRIFAAVNVENSAYPTCMCAERNAIGAAVAAGSRRFVAVAVVTELDKNGQPGTPCGACRQALSELGTGMTVYLAGPEGDAVTALPLAELLPRAFNAENL